MTETQTKRSNGATLQAHYNFNAIRDHLQALNLQLIDLLGDDYAIRLDKPEAFKLKGNPFFRFKLRCLYYTHNERHYDRHPSGWIGVSQTDGQIKFSGCWVCDRPQVIERPEGYQPAPTLLTLSHNDERLLKVLVALGCEEVVENEQPKVAFPVTYADGSQDFHYRVALEGKDKWRHMQGGKASEAVFALHTKGIQLGIQKKRIVVVTESPVDAAVLNGAGFPAIAVLGKGNAEALACDFHKQTLLNLLGDDGVIFVWQENDAEGFAQQVANALQRPVKVINPPVTEEDAKTLKDAFRIWVNYCGKDWEKFKAAIKELLQSATEITPQPEPAIEPKTNGRKVEIPETIFKRLGDIKVQEVEWLVEEYIPIGAVTLLAGEGGAGKSTLLCDLTAAILKGDKWLSKFNVPQGGVILIVTEGAIEIRSRLEGYEITDNNPLEIIDLTAWEDYTPLKAAQALPVILETAKERLRARFGDIPIRLIGLDCLRGFGFDEKQASRQKGDRLPTVREIYTPLADFAEREGSVVIVTHHFRKIQPDERRRLYPKRKKGKEVAPDIDINLLRNLIAGTADIVNAARHALVVVSDFEAGVGIIVPVKSNRSQVLGVPIRYDWQTDAPTFLCFMAEDETAMEKATAFLRRVLANGALASEEVKALAEKEGISNRTLWRAKSRLGVKSARRVNGDEVVWVWFLPDTPNPHGSPQGDGSMPNPADNPKLGTVGTLAQKAQQNLAFSSVPNETGFGTVGTDPSDNQVCQVCQTQNPLAQTLAHLKSPINKGISDQVCQVCQTSGNVEAQPDGDPLWVENEEELWDWFTPERLKPTPPERPAGSPLGDQLSDLQVNQPANEPDQPESDQTASDQSLNEPICPICGEMLEPDPESGLAACLGCGRLFKVETPPVSPDDGDDDNPPETPDDNGQGGSQSGFSPPEAPSIPPDQPSEVGIYTNKFKPPESLNRMTERLPDGSLKLDWQGKTETVAPDDLAGWQPIEDIPDINLPDIESVEIPPVVVLDLETTDTDPKRGRILAAGLALYVEGKEVETQIIRSDDGEANLLAQVFDYLRETCNDLGGFILTGYNIFDFDLTFLIERARKLKVDCPFRYLKDENGEIQRFAIPETNGKFTYKAIETNLPITLIDTQHLVIRWDNFEKVLPDYSLKSVAVHFKVNIPDRPILTPEEIVHAYYHDQPKFNAYLLADLWETYALFAKLIPPYAGVAALTGLNLKKVVAKGRGWIWQQILQRYYTEIPQADETRKYEGGLVVCREGLWFNCAKFDIASLYPTIMLAYRIHSRKDPDQIALRYLKTLTKQRLLLKQKAKEIGDKTAQILQEAMKMLINSLYGYYGSVYELNDFNAAERVTEIGCKVLTCMVAAVEDAGGIVVEADTDGIIVSCQDRDPQEILQAISASIPEVFKVELEWQEAVVFVSDDKNYVVLDRNGDLIAVKGAKWRGRDKEAYLTQAIPTFVRIWATEGKEAALNYAKRVLGEIRNGQGWNWVVRTHRVGKGDKYLIDAGFKVGEIATYAYKVKTNERKEIAKSPDEGYDCDYYAKQFCDIVEEVIEAIDPDQIAAWREIVGREARPLIFFFFSAK
jgi:DNA polymerase elongation subunit (family B)